MRKIKVTLPAYKLSVDVMVSKENDSTHFNPLTFYASDCIPEPFRDTSREVPLPNAVNEIYCSDIVLLNTILNKAAIKLGDILEREAANPF